MPTHVVVEDYEHYAHRKSKNSKLKIILLAVFLLVSIGIIISSFKNNYPSTETENTLSWYEKCIKNCSNAFSEGEEMTKACEIIRGKQYNLNTPFTMVTNPIVCSYKGIIVICSCLKENNSEETCQKTSLDYLNGIGCT